MIEPEEEILRLPRIRVILGALELLREPVAARVGTQHAEPVEERLEIGQHHRGVLDGSAVDPDDRVLAGLPRLAPVQAHTVRQHCVRHSDLAQHQ
jgi:hypothetical protein